MDLVSNTDTEREYISLAEAGDLVGVSKDYLRICIQKKYLRGVKFGRNWVTRKDWLDEYLATYRQSEKSRAESSAIQKHTEHSSSREDLKVELLQDIKNELGPLIAEIRSELAAERIKSIPSARPENPEGAVTSGHTVPEIFEKDFSVENISSELKSVMSVAQKKDEQSKKERPLDSSAYVRNIFPHAVKGVLACVALVAIFGFWFLDAGKILTPISSLSSSTLSSVKHAFSQGGETLVASLLEAQSYEKALVRSFTSTLSSASASLLTSTKSILAFVFATPTADLPSSHLSSQSDCIRSMSSRNREGGESKCPQSSEGHGQRTNLPSPPQAKTCSWAGHAECDGTSPLSSTTQGEIRTQGVIRSPERTSLSDSPAGEYADFASTDLSAQLFTPFGQSLYRTLSQGLTSVKTLLTKGVDSVIAFFSPKPQTLALRPHETLKEPPTPPLKPRYPHHRHQTEALPASTIPILSKHPRIKQSASTSPFPHHALQYIPERRVPDQA